MQHRTPQAGERSNAESRRPGGSRPHAGSLSSAASQRGCRCRAPLSTARGGTTSPYDAGSEGRDRSRQVGHFSKTHRGVSETLCRILHCLRSNFRFYKVFRTLLGEFSRNDRPVSTAREATGCPSSPFSLSSASAPLTRRSATFAAGASISLQKENQIL